MKKKNLELFVIIDDKEIFITTGYLDENNYFKLQEKFSFPIQGFRENKITNLETVTNLIKKNILFLEEKINYTFKDLIIILNNFETSFVNLTGFKNLNGTQVTKENITYILNSLKVYVEEYETRKKILHIFNSKYYLDKKKIDNLPIGLFGDFYSHELSFNLINKNDYKNLINIFENCNLKIRRIFLDSFVKGSFISNDNPKVDTFLYIQIKEDISKIFYIEDDSVKYEQKFNFGTKIVTQDISKITSLNIESIENIIENNPEIEKVSDTEFVEKKYFSHQQYRKIKKNLILKIAEARIKELGELIYLKNINFKNATKEKKVIFLEINDNKHQRCFEKVYTNCFALNNKFDIRVIKNLDLESFVDTASKIDQFGWKKEAIPIIKAKKSSFLRFFEALFH